MAIVNKNNTIMENNNRENAKSSTNNRLSNIIIIVEMRIRTNQRSRKSEAIKSRRVECVRVKSLNETRRRGLEYTIVFNMMSRH
mmetsp:Transcript_19505/g.36350  ORF Transcript_19505/g.36350 Transcript_19505/m.36350 type:complete len:84 (+) Transcript_19505:144-395(+)